MRAAWLRLPGALAGVAGIAALAAGMHEAAGVGAITSAVAALFVGFAALALLARRDASAVPQPRTPLRRLVRPDACADGHTADDHRRAASLVEAHAADSL